MTGTLTRRRVVAAALAGVAGLSLAGVSRRAVAATANTAVTAMPLGGGLFLLQGAGGNVLAADSSEGVLLVDGGAAEHTAALTERLAAECGGRPVRVLLNTHWHWDHTGSNEAFAASGAMLVAHENTRLWLSTDVHCRWQDRTYPRRPKSALPTRTFFYDAERLSFGGFEAEYGHLPQAHTDGDIYVHFPAQNVLVAGDVVSGGSYPVLDWSTGGWIGGMILALESLLEKTDARTRIVPGSGPLRTRADVEAQLQMCRTVIGRISQSYYSGQTWDEFLASAPTREFDAVWGDPGVFLRTAYDGAWGHITEIRRFTRQERA